MMIGEAVALRLVLRADHQDGTIPFSIRQVALESGLGYRTTYDALRSTQWLGWLDIQIGEKENPLATGSLRLLRTPSPYPRPSVATIRADHAIFEPCKGSGRPRPGQVFDCAWSLILADEPLTTAGVTEAIYGPSVSRTLRRGVEARLGRLADTGLAARVEGLWEWVATADMIEALDDPSFRAARQARFKAEREAFGLAPARHDG